MKVNFKILNKGFSNLTEFSKIVEVNISEAW